MAQVQEELPKKPEFIPGLETERIPTELETSPKQLEDLADESVETLHSTGLPVAEDIARSVDSDLDSDVKTNLTNIDNEAAQARADLKSNIERIKEQETVNQEMVDSYREFVGAGPKVGETSVIDKHTGKPTRMDVRVKRESKNTLQFSLCNPDGDRHFQAYADLQEINPADLASDKYHPHHAKRSYGNDPESNPYIYVDIMKAHNNYQFKGLGKRLHEIAVERSFQVGDEGRVQLFAGGVGSGMSWQEPKVTSTGFHESFGFLGKDVYKEDGTLHHTGQSINQSLAEDRFQTAEHQKKYGTMKPGQDVHDRWHHLGSEVQAFMYLPPEVIDREKQRMHEQPILQANVATTEALLQKHEKLSTEYYARKEAEALEEQLEATLNAESPSEYSVHHLWSQIGEKYLKAGNKERAAEYFNKLADSHAQHEDSYGNLTEAVEYYAKAGNAGKLREIGTRAGQLAEKHKLYSDAINFYTQAGNEAAVRRLTEERDPSHRDY